MMDYPIGRIAELKREEAVISLSAVVFGSPGSATLGTL
jgi:hypothetical protein